MQIGQYLVPQKYFESGQKWLKNHMYHFVGAIAPPEIRPGRLDFFVQFNKTPKDICRKSHENQSRSSMSKIDQKVKILKKKLEFSMLRDFSRPHKLILNF